MARVRLSRAKSAFECALRCLVANDLAGAESRGRRAAEALAEVLGADAPATLDARQVVAFALSGQHRWAEAEQELRLGLEAMAGGEPTNPSVLALRAALAEVLKKTGRLAEAEAEARLALTGPFTSLGRNRLHAHSVLANILGDQGRHQEAAGELLFLACEFARRGEAHRPMWLKVRSDRLAQLTYLGLHDEVALEASALRADAAKIHGEPAVLLGLAVANALAVSLCLQERHTEAEELLRPAVAGTQWRANHTFALLLRVNLARALTGQDRADEALTVLSAAEDLAARMGATSPHDAGVLTLARASALLAAGRFAEAEAQARTSVELCEQHLAPIHHRALEARTVLAATIGRQRQPEGERLQAEVTEAWVEHFGAHHHGASRAREI